MTEMTVQMGPQEFLAVCAQMTMRTEGLNDDVRIAMSRVFGFAAAEWDMSPEERGGLHHAVVELGRVLAGGRYRGPAGAAQQANWDQNNAEIRNAFEQGNL